MKFIGWKKVKMFSWEKMYKLKNGDIRYTHFSTEDYNRQCLKLKRGNNNG